MSITIMYLYINGPFWLFLILHQGFPGSSSSKESPAKKETKVLSLGPVKDPWRRNGNSSSILAREIMDLGAW